MAAVSVLFSSTLCVAEEGPHYVSVLASEKLMGDWIGSWFKSFDGAGRSPNECEMAISDSLAQKGFVLPSIVITGKQLEESRKFHTVFARYGDLSTLPNDTAIKAAGIIDPRSVATIVCGVRAKPMKNSAGVICANVGCKAIDMKSRRRVVAEAAEKCAKGQDRMSTSLAAIKDVCRFAGDNLADKLSQRY